MDLHALSWILRRRERDSRHCEFRIGLRPVPLDETGHRFSIHSGGLSRDEPLHYFSFSVRKLPVGCFATSLLAMTIQLDRRMLVAGANGGGIKAPSKPFSKLLQNSRVLLQAFPNKALAVLWDFKGLQGFQTSFDAFQIFRLGPSLSAAFCLSLRCNSVDGAFIAEQRPRSREF